jgi:hypothetical protein
MRGVDDFRMRGTIVDAYTKSVLLFRKLAEPINLTRDKEDQCWAQELEAAAKRFQSNGRWQAGFRKTLERLGKDPQRTLEGELAMAESEDPEHFLVLLLTLTDGHYLSRKDIRCFLDTKWEQITPIAFRNALRTYRRLFLQCKSSPKQKHGSHFTEAPIPDH